MATAIDAPVVSDGRWHALAVDWPESCRLHHCWVDECPAGAHNADDEVADSWSTS